MQDRSPSPASQSACRKRPPRESPFAPPLESLRALKALMATHYFAGRYADGAVPVAWVTSGFPVELLRTQEPRGHQEELFLFARRVPLVQGDERVDFGRGGRGCPAAFDGDEPRPDRAPEALELPMISPGSMRRLNAWDKIDTSLFMAMRRAALEQRRTGRSVGHASGNRERTRGHCRRGRHDAASAERCDRKRPHALTRCRPCRFSVSARRWWRWR